MWKFWILCVDRVVMVGPEQARIAMVFIDDQFRHLRQNRLPLFLVQVPHLQVIQFLVRNPWPFIHVASWVVEVRPEA